MKQLTFTLAADHPTGIGHFPGNPIIPGALLLAEVLRSIGAATGSRFVSCKVSSAKFHHPARPGDSVVIAYSYLASGAIDFQCTVAATRVLSGVISAAN